MDVADYLEQVHDRESFFRFVRALIADREAAIQAEKRQPTELRGLGPDAGGWYNLSIETYLEAALAWAETTGMGQTQGLPTDPSWKAFAVFLYCGKIYE